jgi:hypothetical protein
MWYAIDPSQAPADEVHGLHIFDSLNVMGSGGDPDFGYGVGMIRTSDGGLNWNYDELDIQGNAYDLDFRNNYEAWAPLGPRRLLIYSMDAGNTWTSVLPPDNAAMYDMTFPDSLHGFAVGKEGVVLKYYPPVIPFTGTVRSAQPGYTLQQNSPNPVQTIATIRYSVPPGGETELHANGKVSALQLKVYDLFGQEVGCLEAEAPFPGNHAFSFDASGLPGGVYFYLLQHSSNGQTLTVAGPGRMCVVR